LLKRDEEKQRADERQVLARVLGAHGPFHEAEHHVAEDLEQVAQAEARRRHRAAIRAAPNAHRVAEGEQREQKKDQETAQDVVDLEVRGLEDLPGPLAAEVDFEVSTQGFVPREETEPSGVWTHALCFPLLAGRGAYPQSGEDQRDWQNRYSDGEWHEGEIVDAYGKPDQPEENQHLRAKRRHQPGRLGLVARRGPRHGTPGQAAG
jgi:hypothetical protein